MSRALFPDEQAIRMQSFARHWRRNKRTTAESGSIDTYEHRPSRSAYRIPTGSTDLTPILSEGLNKASSSFCHGWMRLRIKGAKQSMGKHFASIGRRRPSLDILESRHLLSGDMAAVSVQPAPADIAGWNFQNVTHGPDSAWSAGIPGPYETAFASLRELQAGQDAQLSGQLFFLNASSRTLIVVPMPAGKAYDFPGGPGIPAFSSLSVAPVSFSPIAPRVAGGPGMVAPPLSLFGPPGRSFVEASKAKPQDSLTAHDPLERPPGVPFFMDSPSAVSSIPTAYSAFLEPQIPQLGVGANPSIQLAIPIHGINTVASHAGVLVGIDASSGDMLARIGTVDEALASSTGEGVRLHVLPASVNSQASSGSLAAGKAVETDRIAVIPTSVAKLEPERLEVPEEPSLPQSAGMITCAIPFDRAALEQAVDQFFAHLEEGLGMGELPDQGTARVLPLFLTVLGTVSVVELARRRLRSRGAGWKSAARQVPLGSEELLGFPELPGSWSTRLT